MPPKAISETGRGWERIHELQQRPNCFGQYLLKPQFGGTGSMTKDLESFYKRVDEIPTHEEGHIYAGLPRGTDLVQPIHMPYRKSIFKVSDGGNPIDPVPVADVSVGYGFCDHRDMLLSLGDEVQSAGVHMRGEIRLSGNQMRGRFIFEDPQFEVPLLTLFDDFVKITLDFQNSVDGTLRWGGMGGGVRMICSNYNMWGDILGAVYGRHTGEVKVKFDKLLSNVLGRAKRLTAINDRAWEDPIDPTKCWIAMLGAHIPPSFITPIIKDFVQLEPMTETDLNRYTVYNAVTAFVTRSEIGDHVAERALKRANNLLTKDTDKLVKEGERILEKEREKELEASLVAPLAPVQ